VFSARLKVPNRRDLCSSKEKSKLELKPVFVFFVDPTLLINPF